MYEPIDNEGAYEFEAVNYLEQNTLKILNDLSDLNSPIVARSNLDVYSKDEVNGQIASLAGGFEEVADITARDALDATVKRVHVVDNGDGKWAKYERTTTGWTMVADQDQYLSALTQIPMPVPFSKTIASDKIVLEHAPVNDVIIMPLLIKNNKASFAILTKDTADTSGKTWKVTPKTAGLWDGSIIKGVYFFYLDTGVNPQ